MSGHARWQVRPFACLNCKRAGGFAQCIYRTFMSVWPAAALAASMLLLLLLLLQQ